MKSEPRMKLLGPWNSKLGTWLLDELVSAEPDAAERSEEALVGGEKRLSSQTVSEEPRQRGSRGFRDQNAGPEPGWLVAA